MNFSTLGSRPILAFCLFSVAVTVCRLPVSLAQSPDQIVKWTAVPAAQRVNPGARLTVTLSGTIQDGWHTYSITQPRGGPVPTTIKLPPMQPFKLAGPITGSEPERIFDPNFSMQTEIHSDRVVYTLPVAVDANTKPGNHELSIAVRFQACNDHICLPPATLPVKTSLRVDGKAKALAAPATNNRPAAAAISSAATTDSNAEDAAILASRSSVQEDQQTAKPTVVAQSFRSFLWLAVVMGALSLLTPCVFPMIPITISYFTTHSAGSRKTAWLTAAVYGIGIILTFSALGMLLSAVFGAGGVNRLATNPWVNLLVAAFFLAFAFSLFGVYFIQVPAGLLNKLDAFTRSKETAKAIGALLMASTFTLTSFTCTAAFVGTLLVMAAQGNWRWPLAGMLAFSTAFAMPFFVLALAPQMLARLPKAGVWMEQLKIVLGFLEIAAAVKFLSNSDLIWHGGIFTRQLVLSVWIGIGVLCILFVLGFRIKQRPQFQSVGAVRLAVAIVFLVSTMWMIRGLFGHQLGELESFLPPESSSQRTSGASANSLNDISWLLNDYDGALSTAKQSNKLVFVDFTGYTCTNCRWMEANMFPRSQVTTELNKFVCLRLYTDGDGELYQRQQKMQQEKFGTVALPLYALLRSDGTAVGVFLGLTRNENDFLSFLRTGLHHPSGKKSLG